MALQATEGGWPLADRATEPGRLGISGRRSVGPAV
nr:MAG TPA: hypothetical protein [Caudoviricetes sp.]